MQCVISMLKFVVFITTLNVLSAKNKGDKLHSIVRTNEFGNCKDRPIRPFHLTQRRIYTPSKNVYAVLGEGYNSKAMISVEKVEVNVTKCLDRSKTQCEHYQRLEWKSGAIICPMLVVTMAPYISVLGAFHPLLKCPYPKGNFTLDMKPDFEAVKPLQFEGNYYWIVQFEFSDEKLKPWLCFLSESDFPKVRG